MRNLMILGKRTVNYGATAINPSIKESLENSRGKLKKKIGEFHPLIVLVVGVIGLILVGIYKSNTVPQMNSAINTCGSLITSLTSSVLGSGSSGSGTN